MERTELRLIVSSRHDLRRARPGEPAVLRLAIPKDLELRCDTECFAPKPVEQDVGDDEEPRHGQTSTGSSAHRPTGAGTECRSDDGLPQDNAALQVVSSDDDPLVARCQPKSRYTARELGRHFPSIDKTPNLQVAFGGWFGTPHAIDCLGLLGCRMQVRFRSSECSVSDVSAHAGVCPYI